MRISGNTILITGGTSGIGFELARRFLSLDNTVIVTGRSRPRLDVTRQRLPGVHAIQSDVSDVIAITRLDQRIASEFPGLNVLINNAGIMRKINLHTLPADLHDITREVEINLNGPIRMVAQFAAPGTAKTSRHRQRLIRASICAAGDSAGLLRNKSCDPLLHPIAASATEKHERRRIRTGAADHRDGPVQGRHQHRRRRREAYGRREAGAGRDRRDRERSSGDFGRA